MLDVHAPEHPISGVRDFFLHLFTITCGLLIALGLENAAEALHHRQERKEAEAIIREEITENRESLRQSVGLVQQEHDNLLSVLTFVEDRSSGGMKPPPGHLGFNFSEEEIQDVAWRTVSTNGVLAYMDYAQVGKFAGAYREQELLQTQEQQTLSDFLQLISFRPASGSIDQLTREQATAALPLVRKALGDLVGVSAVARGTLATYDEALK